MFSIFYFRFVLCFSFMSLMLGAEISDEVKEMIASLHKTCQGETQVDEGVITNAQNGNFAEDPKLKCYMKCVMTEMAVMEDDGAVDVQAALELIPEEAKARVSPVVKKCTVAGDSGPCDSAFTIFKCLYENGKDDFLLP